jgi:hypothetical protein
MAVGRGRGTFEQLVPEEERAVMDSEGMGRPDAYIRAADDPAYYPPAVLDFLRDNQRLILDREIESFEAARAVPTENGETESRSSGGLNPLGALKSAVGRLSG